MRVLTPKLRMKRSATVLVLLSLFGFAFSGSSSAQSTQLPQIEWPSFDSAIAAASKSGKIVLIDIFSPTCGWCRKLQTTVYTQSDIQTYMRESFELGRLDITVSDDTISYKGYSLSSAQLGAGFGATGTPTTIFLSPEGEYITRLPGFHEHDELFDVMKFIGTESFREMSFIEYQEQAGNTGDSATGE